MPIFSCGYCTLFAQIAQSLRYTHFTKTSLTEADAGMPALIALFLLVLTGIIGRLLDLWQAHEIAAEANSNGVGIPQAVEERLLELQLTVERLSAGKSAAFKRYCVQALSNNGSLLTGCLRWYHTSRSTSGASMMC